MEETARTYTTLSRGLDKRLIPMRLWEKAKRLGIWDPASVDLSQDLHDWQQLSASEQELLLRLTAQFQGGEEAVTTDLLPFLQVAAAEGRLEDEMFLTSYLWEESKHVEAFDRFLSEVVDGPATLEDFLTSAHHQLFLALEQDVATFATDANPENYLRATVTYQMVVEGILAETGYQAYYTVLREREILPGMQEIVQLIQRDEARHIAYGLYTIGRLLNEDGEERWSIVENRVQDLLPVVLAIVEETLAPFGEDIPFGVTADQFLQIGMSQFQKRFARLERMRGQSLDEIMYGVS